MPKFLTCETLTTGCSRRPRIFYPSDVVVEFQDENNPRVKAWIKRKQIRQVPDDMPLTEPSVIREKMKGLIIRKGRVK